MKNGKCIGHDKTENELLCRDYNYRALIHRPWVRNAWQLRAWHHIEIINY